MQRLQPVTLQTPWAYISSAHLLGELGSRLVEEEHLLLRLQLVVRLRDARVVEGVGLDDVRASGEVLLVDLLDHVRPRDDEQVVVALEVLGVVLVALPTIVLLLELIRLDGGAHGAVDHDYALLHDLDELVERGRLLHRARERPVLGHGRQLSRRLGGAWIETRGSGVRLWSSRERHGCRGRPVLALEVARRALRVERRGELQHVLGRVGAPVEQHVLHVHQQLPVNVLVLVLDHLSRVDDAHVHARLARMEQEGGVESAAHGLVPAEGEGEVRHASADLAPGTQALDLPRRVDEVHAVVVVLLHARPDGEDLSSERGNRGGEPNMNM